MWVILFIALCVIAWYSVQHDEMKREIYLKDLHNPKMDAKTFFERHHPGLKSHPNAKQLDDVREQEAPLDEDQNGVPDEVRQLEWDQLGGLIESSEEAWDDERA